MKTSEGMVDAYTVFVGGYLGEDASFNTQLKGRIRAEQVTPVLRDLILFFKERRQAGEPFHRFVRRVGIPAIQERLDEILVRESGR